MNITNLTAMLLIGLASNLDNAGVGTAYGVRKIRISFLANSIIACTGFVLALAGGLFGDWLSLYVTPFLCNFLGMIVLVAVGIWVMSQSFIGEKKQSETSGRNLFVRILRNPEAADLDGSKAISFIESIVLGIALSINNLAGGFDAGITHLNIWIASLISGMLSYLCVGLFAYVGYRFAADKLGKKASVVSGILLVLLGLHQVM